MKLRQITLVMVMFVTTSCHREIEVSMNVTNTTDSKVANCWVNAGVRDIDIGVLIPDPKSTRGHHSFPATVGSNVSIKWRFENDRTIYSASNLLSETIQRYEEITILIATDGAVGSKNPL